MSGSVEQRAAHGEHSFAEGRPRRRRGMRGRVKIRQRWLRLGDDRVFVVHRVNIKDEQVELRTEDGAERILVSYFELQRKWGEVA